MTRRRRRLAMVLACGVGLSGAIALGLAALGQDINLFLMPGQVAAHPPPAGRLFRLGGLVAMGSVHRSVRHGKPSVRFIVTDGKGKVTVVYVGILPDLFRQGQGIVALGRLRPDGVFEAEQVLAKHDAAYMPKSIEEALKKRGLWNPDSGAPAPSAAIWDGLGQGSGPS